MSSSPSAKTKRKTKDAADQQQSSARPSSREPGQQQQTQQRAPPSTTDQLRMALHMTAETEEIGTETLTELQRQHEQLDRTQRKVDEVDAHVERGNWILKGMKSWFGLRGKEPKKPKEVVAEKRKERNDERGASSAGSGAGSSGGSADGVAHGSSGGRNAAVSVGQPQTVKSRDPRHAEEDAILDQISSSLVRVKAQAQDIGSEIKSQDAVLEDLSTSLGKVDTKIKKATSTAKKLAS